MIVNQTAEKMERWLYAERYLTIGTRDYSPFSKINEVGKEFQPEGGKDDFEVECVRLHPPARSVFLTTDHPAAGDLRKLYVDDTGALIIPIHPSTQLLPPWAPANAYESSFRLRVSPTASTRTVFVRDIIGGPNPYTAHFAKLHFPGRISRFTRHLSQLEVEAQLWVSQALQRHKAPHLPDVAGGYVHLDGGTVGFLLRSPIPSGVEGAARYIVPTFSLYGGDLRSPADLPLLAQLPHLFDEAPLHFVAERIVRPAVRLWVSTARALGILPEMHGQNLLFGFDPDARNSALIMRDCEVYVDTAWRSALSLSPPAPLHLRESEMVQQNRSGFYSLCYDGFLANNLLEKIAESARLHLAVDRDDLISCAIDEFNAAGGADLPFDQSVSYYEGKLHDGASFTLTQRATHPTWR